MMMMDNLSHVDFAHILPFIAELEVRHGVHQYPLVYGEDGVPMIDMEKNVWSIVQAESDGIIRLLHREHGLNLEVGTISTTEVLGSGEYGEVYKATITTAGDHISRRLAIKVQKADFDDAYRKRIQRHPDGDVTYYEKMKPWIMEPIALAAIQDKLSGTGYEWLSPRIFASLVAVSRGEPLIFIFMDIFDDAKPIQHYDGLKRWHPESDADYAQVLHQYIKFETLVLRPLKMKNVDMHGGNIVVTGHGADLRLHFLDPGMCDFEISGARIVLHSMARPEMFKFNLGIWYDKLLPFEVQAPEIYEQVVNEMLDDGGAPTDDRLAEIQEGLIQYINETTFADPIASILFFEEGNTMYAAYGYDGRPDLFKCLSEIRAYRAEQGLSLSGMVVIIRARDDVRWVCVREMDGGLYYITNPTVYQHQRVFEPMTLYKHIQPRGGL